MSNSTTTTTTNTSGTISMAKIIMEYGIIEGPCKTEMKVVGNPAKPWVNDKLANVSATYSHSYLVNFKAIDIRKLQLTMDTFAGRDSIPFSEFKNINMVKEIIVHRAADGSINEPDLPVADEIVVCNVDYALNKKDGGFVMDKVNKGQKVLEISSIQVKKAEKLKSFGSFVQSKAQETTSDANAAAQRASVTSDETEEGEDY